MSAVAELIAGARNREPLDPESWRSLWTGLRERTIDRNEVETLLWLLCDTPPPLGTFEGFIASLAPPVGASPPIPGAANVVGTGGGPSTLNVSTAAALVAAATGVPVVKSGSRRYASLRGSADMLDLLQLPRTRSDGEVVHRLAADGIVFVGQHAYPPELALLARRLLPRPLKPYGAFLNIVGPFLARVPVEVQVTGVSDRRVLPVLRALAAASRRRVWLVHNDLGVDELLGMADNVVETADRAPVEIPAGDLTPGDGELADLAPIGSPRAAARHFALAISGRAAPAVTEAIALNAAAVVVASDGASWSTAVDRCLATMEAGDALGLLPAGTVDRALTAAVR